MTDYLDCSFQSLQEARVEYDYIFGVDWRDLEAGFNQDKKCFKDYCLMQASIIEESGDSLTFKDLATDIRRLVISL